MSNSKYRQIAAIKSAKKTMFPHIFRRGLFCGVSRGPLGHIGSANPLFLKNSIFSIFCAEMRWTNNNRDADRL